ncbi:MAG TPA: hypothetical protein P5232_02850 [Candidatus Moranbacteria bacterium]|nr:hypothetical protein [Candidatus Moranbacteria bacterium]
MFFTKDINQLVAGYDQIEKAVNELFKELAKVSTEADIPLQIFESTLETLKKIRSEMKKRKIPKEVLEQISKKIFEPAVETAIVRIAFIEDKLEGKEKKKINKSLMNVMELIVGNTDEFILHVDKQAAMAFGDKMYRHNIR